MQHAGLYRRVILEDKCAEFQHKCERRYCPIVVHERLKIVDNPII